jgi:predicted DNA-binding transcriptional regulator AlpA
MEVRGMKLKLLVSVVTVKADADNQFEELIPEVQLAAEVGVVDRTVREWRERATGPDYIRIGRSIFYRRSAIAEWIEGRTVRHRTPRSETARSDLSRIGHTADIAA